MLIGSLLALLLLAPLHVIDLLARWGFVVLFDLLVVHDVLRAGSCSAHRRWTTCSHSLCLSLSNQSQYTMM
jgi:hypothetical protein